MAHAIHVKRANAAARPLICVNCAVDSPSSRSRRMTRPHQRGVHRRYSRPRRPVRALAHGATLFLDEVDEISRFGLARQPLRVLVSNSSKRVGEENTRNIDVRIIAATKTAC